MDRRQFCAVSGIGICGVALGRVPDGDGLGFGGRGCCVGEAQVVCGGGGVRYLISSGARRVERVGVVCAEACDVGAFGERFRPVAGAVGGDGRLYVVDGCAGRVCVFDGTRGVGVIGEGAIERGCDVAVDGAGRVYVADVVGHRVVVLGRGGRAERTIGSFGMTPSAGLNGPRGVTICEDEVHVLDAGHRRVCVFSKDGGVRASYGEAEGLVMPTSLVSDGDGRVVVADPGRGEVLVFRDGALVSSCAVRDRAGARCVPLRVSTLRPGMVHVSTGGLEAWC